MILCKSEQAKAVDKALFPGMQGGPLMHVIAAKAVAFREALKPDFALYQGRITKNAAVLAEELMRRDFRLVSGGTDNHLILVNLADRGLTGRVMEQALDKAGLTVNKNSVPFDPQPPMVTSGIRLGTPAVTTRGFGPDEMVKIAEWVGRVARNPEDEAEIARIKGEIAELCKAFPLYPDFEG